MKTASYSKQVLTHQVDTKVICLTRTSGAPGSNTERIFSIINEMLPSFLQSIWQPASSILLLFFFLSFSFFQSLFCSSFFSFLIHLSLPSFLSSSIFLPLLPSFLPSFSLHSFIIPRCLRFILSLIIPLHLFVSVPFLLSFCFHLPVPTNTMIIPNTRYYK